jgi:hypothetical protein
VPIPKKVVSSHPVHGAVYSIQHYVHSQNVSYHLLCNKYYQEKCFSYYQMLDIWTVNICCHWHIMQTCNYTKMFSTKNSLSFNCSITTELSLLMFKWPSILGFWSVLFALLWYPWWLLTGIKSHQPLVQVWNVMSFNITYCWFKVGGTWLLLYCQ